MQGVAENFIGILRDEERHRWRSLLRFSVLFLVVVLLAGLVADLPERGSLFGTATGLAILAGLIGAGLGFVWGRFVVVRRYRASLVRSWNQWMRFSVACNRVDEVHRRVLGKPAVRSVGWLAALWAVVLFVTLVLFVVTVLNGAPAWDQAPLFVGYAGLAGFLVAQRVALALWVRSLLVSLDDMVRRGEVALWGVL